MSNCRSSRIVLRSAAVSIFSQKLCNFAASEKFNMPGYSVFPPLTGQGVSFSRPGQGLKNTKKATCYINSIIQAWAHTPNIVNLAKETWKKRCGCSSTSTCWLCYMGLRTASIHSHEDLPESEGNSPVWLLKRVHLLLPNSSTAKRNQQTFTDPEQARPAMMMQFP